MPRWPVAGPSEYWLLASNPATNVCKTVTKVCKTVKRIVTLEFWASHSAALEIQFFWDVTLSSWASSYLFFARRLEYSATQPWEPRILVMKLSVIPIWHVLEVLHCINWQIVTNVYRDRSTFMSMAKEYIFFDWLTLQVKVPTTSGLEFWWLLEIMLILNCLDVVWHFLSDWGRLTELSKA